MKKLRSSKYMDKYLNSERFIDKIEDLIENTWLEDPYYYCYRKFKYGWWNPVTAYLKVRYGVENLIKYFHVIWNDRDWDWSFWIDLNLKKLKNMEHNIRNYGNHVYHERDADNIHKAILALERIRNDDYHENVFKNHDKKYGELKTKMKPMNDGTGSAQMLFHRDNVKTEKEIKYERDASRRLYNHERYMQKQDLEYATRIINKYLFTWWD